MQFLLSKKQHQFLELNLMELQSPYPIFYSWSKKLIERLEMDDEQKLLTHYFFSELDIPIICSVINIQNVLC